MNNVLGIVVLAEDESHIQELTEARIMGAIPFAGRYRLIDFILSNMVNSGLRSVAMLFGERSQSLLNHLSASKSWDLNSRKGGLIYWPFKNEIAIRKAKGSFLACLREHLQDLKDSPQEYILISNSNCIINLDFVKVFDFAEKKDADIILVYSKIDGKHAEARVSALTLDLSKDNKVIGVTEHINRLVTGNIYSEIIYIKKNILIEVIEYSEENELASVASLIRIISEGKYKTYGFKNTGYFAVIESLSCYYAESMKILGSEHFQEIFLSEDFPIFTKALNLAPALIKTGAIVNNSLISSGSRIEGVVEFSVLSRDVLVKKGAIVKDSIILSDCIIEEDAEVIGAIIDKNSVVMAKEKIIKSDNETFTYYTSVNYK
ncbi:MAG: glucose-1-phosphate adenylyltransferase subunit GlgD [Clostridia bacterium]